MSTNEPRRFPSSGGELVYADLGTGEPVLLLHGFPSSSETWRELAPALARRFRVIVPDLLGHGRSERPLHAALDLRAQARYVGELLEHLGVGRLAIVGHAHGGGIAQLLALEGLDVGAMVLVSSVAFDAWPVESTRDLGAANAFDGPDLTGHEDAFAAWAFPILILWGEEDPFLPPSLAERLQEAMPSSALGLLPGIGHFVFDEAGPTVVPMVAEWLRAQYLGAPHTHGDTHAGVVLLQLERRSALEDLAEYEREDPPVHWDPDEQEVGPNA